MIEDKRRRDATVGTIFAGFLCGVGTGYLPKANRDAAVDRRIATWATVCSEIEGHGFK